MIQVARDQMIQLSQSTWIRVLSMQPDMIRLGITSHSGLQISGGRTGTDVTVRVTLASVHGNTAGLEVDASGVSIERSCTQLDIQKQMQTTQNVEFVTLRVGECVGFTESSESNSQTH